MRMDCERRMEVLRQGLKEMASQLYAEEVLSLVADSVKKVLDCLSCGVLLIDEHGGVRVKISRGLSYSYIKELHASPGHDLINQILQNPRILVVKEGESLYGKGFEHPYKSLVVVPLVRGKDEVLGVLFADSDRDDAFQGEALEFLQDMALLTVVALDYYETKDKLISFINIDPLTELYNFKHFHELLYREILRADETRHPFSLMLFSIAGMANYNSAFGHVKGDQLLRDVAELIKSRVRRFDVVARYSGAKMVVIMPESDKEEASRKAREILEAFEGGYWAQTDPRYVYFKGAVVTYPQDADDEKELLHNLEEALYEAKRVKGSKVVIYGRG
ncbi:MAG: hypothetical protein DRI93_00715 [Aquificota bacterium]|nr:MAG: hypothetical protein DRI93_00715 [Aquificota bacterium]